MPHHHVHITPALRTNQIIMHITHHITSLTSHHIIMNITYHHNITSHHIIMHITHHITSTCTYHSHTHHSHHTPHHNIIHIASHHHDIIMTSSLHHSPRSHALDGSEREEQTCECEHGRIGEVCAVKEWTQTRNAECLLWCGVVWCDLIDGM